MSRSISRRRLDEAAARTPGWGIPVAAALVALGIGCYQLSLPHVLTGVLGWNEGYDDSVDVGAAIRLVHGVLPYRSFVIVHPPGIELLMSPAALVGLAGGSRAALVVGNCLGVVVTAANAALAGWLVRSAGKLAMAVSSFFLALWPLTVAVDRTVELEPFLVLFVLVGVAILFGTDGAPSRRRAIAGGLVLGFAFVVKVWAFMPLVAAGLVWLPRIRREGRWLALGILGGVVVPCAPFFLAAPRSFVHDVFLDQLTRKSLTATTPFGQRLLKISGLDGLTAFRVSGGVAVALFIVLLAVISVVYGLRWRARTRFEWFALVVAAVTFAGMFDSPTLFDHYAYFPAAMTAPLLGICAGRLPRALLALPAFSYGALAVALAAIGFLVQQDSSYAQAYLSEASDTSDLARYIPAGSCVLSDYPPDLIDSNRFTSSSPGCPAVLDPYGMFLSDDGGSTPHPNPPYSTRFELKWFSWLQQADYLELRGPFDDFIPWTPQMAEWFDQNYRLVVHLRTVYPRPYIDGVHDMWLYQRIH